MLQGTHQALVDDLSQDCTNAADLDDLWETARDGEIYRWNGQRLVPADPEIVALLRQIDAERLRVHQQGVGRQTRPAVRPGRPAWRLAGSLRTWLISPRSGTKAH
jgi:hypothetical protein